MRVPRELRLPAPIVAAEGDLPRDVARALRAAPPGRRIRVEAAGIPWSALTWGDGGGTPLLLVHGVTGSAGTWWRMGPALAASGFRVVAPDLPGHGHTGHWLGHHRFRDNAADLAAFVDGAGIASAGLRVVGHSWGAMTVAALPATGLRPAVLVLVDPPAMSRAAIAAMLDDPLEREYEDPVTAERAVRDANPAWTRGDVRAKVEELTKFDREAARAVLLDNGDWDAGLADLAHPAATDVPVWIVRGEPATGSYLSEAALPALADRIGRDRILTIAGGPHSPHRTHPEATLVAWLTALGS